MRTHKELLIATRQFASENLLTSWWHLVSTLAVIATLARVTCSDLHWSWRVVTSVALGLVIVRLFVLYHDHQHGAILSGSRGGNLLMRCVGFVLLCPSSAWQRSHNHHHAHNSKLSTPDIGSYPLLTVEEYRSSKRLKRIAYVIERHPVTMLFGYLTVFLYGMCVRPLIANPRRHLDGAIAIVVHASLLLWIGFDELDDLCLTALLPFSIASAVGAYLFYAQHNYPGARPEPTHEWDYTTAALDASSYIKMGPVWSWLTANIGYHHVHHLNSRIPFYRLPETMWALPELQTPGTSTLHPLDIHACLRLKLWDPEAEQLVSWQRLRNAA
jgi:acyl-lipid omega-6 desaturase (Delta-12 desaturase)